MENEKSCDNCFWFVRHYIKMNKSFKPLSEGHCKHDKIRRKVPVLCKYYESAEIKIEQKQKSISKFLISLCERLDQLIEIFENDIEYRDLR